MTHHKVIQYSGVAVLLLAMVFLLAGCQKHCKLHERIGYFFGSPYGIEFPEPIHLGTHRYNGGYGENNGMVYTCKGGFIDIAHLRESADRTANLAELTFHNLMMERTEFSFQIIEPAHYFVNIQYPPDWDGLGVDEKAARAEYIAVRLGQYLAQKTTVWHEIITWFGFASFGVFSEHVSAFSWEDPYSDLMGTQLAIRAMESSQHPYEEAMTLLLNKQLAILGAQPAKVSENAARMLENQWYATKVHFLIRMLKRNFDIGTDDGAITPWLVPGICPDAQPLPLPVPNLEFLKPLGFCVELEIEPKELEKNKILEALNLDGHTRIRPEIHFPIIMEYIKKEAYATYGQEVELPQIEAVLDQQSHCLGNKTYLSLPKNLKNDKN
jgi:hypothetical protein